MLSLTTSVYAGILIFVGIGTSFGMDGPEFKSRSGRDSSCRPGRPRDPPTPVQQASGVFTGDKLAGAYC